MEAAVAGEDDHTYLNYSRDVMDLMTQLRKDWGVDLPRRRVGVFENRVKKLDLCTGLQN